MDALHKEKVHYFRTSMNELQAKVLPKTRSMHNIKSIANEVSRHRSHPLRTIHARFIQVKL